MLILLVLLTLFNWELSRSERRAAVLERRSAVFSADVSRFTEDSREFHFRATQAVQSLAMTLREEQSAILQQKK